MREIIRNRIKCKYCGDVIESIYRNDFKSCSCGRVSVDGLLDEEGKTKGKRYRKRVQ